MIASPELSVFGATLFADDATVQGAMERKLAAILAADVVAYSALMEADEAGTFERLRASRKELFEPEIDKRHGRIFKLMGDGLLAEFGSAVDAVECAVTLQRGMVERNASVPESKRIEVRIGINLGEVIIEGDDRHGEGVNVAARLQQVADPGGICVSGKVSKEVEKKLAFGLEPMGKQRMKNIAEPIACYRVRLQTSSASAKPDRPLRTPPGLPNRAAIAVLPFTNMSSDPEQEYFADGLAEDLITDLSKVPGLLVISRHSAFAYKGKSVDIRVVATDLGVRFVVEGSVRRVAARVRINVQLIDPEDGTHLWADRFDRDLADIFMVQDEVVGRIVDALSHLLPSAHPVARQRATNLEAYDLFVRGRVLVTQSVQSNREARPLLERAIELDPGFADAHAWLAMSHVWGWSYWGEAPEPGRSLALAAARRAVSLDPENAGAHAILGFVRFLDGRLDAGAPELTTALEINPNHSDAWAFLGVMKAFEGSAGEGIDSLRNAFRLNPHPPGWYYWHLGLVQYLARQYEDAVETLRHEATHRSGSQRILAASLAQLGRMDEAKTEAAQFLVAHPNFSVEDWASRQPFQRREDRQCFVEGYLKAGLPG
ncbi:adenylate/guanylate cyclase domain-containing protein [Mesorhizobium dulcispinae]|uniref:adenylate/guanylate cyclase domain-containing protein n=1 Tax=Mesorhizobium dulcispinae TaxID=3072316 RepID=UPI002A245897|nr:adenylate/guanylate cyclase domain-containing protein [Mesorhizobium sp. VK23D]MDX8517514.1 adenylate/guanylate cyclase domain-containing protein [Mesorhizobium sp. VK23D]